MTINGRIKVNVTGARGPSFLQSARATGAYGANANDTDAQIYDKFADYAIGRNPGIRATTEARALLYGIANPADQRLFAAQGYEFSFADGVYRNGYSSYNDIRSMPNVEITSSPAINGRGYFVDDPAAIDYLKSSFNDVTFMVEADVPADDGTRRSLASYVGDNINNIVEIFRSDTGIYAVAVNRDGALVTMAGPEDHAARRIRIAVSVSENATRVSFAGGEVITVNALRPATLTRLWFGRTSLGYGAPLQGYVTRSLLLPYTVSDTLLQALSGGAVSDDSFSQIVSERIAIHDNDLDAHSLAPLRLEASLADSKTGLWQVRASDTFNRADGPLGSTETGGYAWSGSLVVRSNRMAHPTGGFDGARIDSGFSEGQVEADLYPGAGEASIMFRASAAGDVYRMLQRTPDGGISLVIVNGGVATQSTQPTVAPVQAGERYKVRYVGKRIWAFRIYNGVETLLFDVPDTVTVSNTYIGIRLNGGGTADNFKALSRDAL